MSDMNKIFLWGPSGSGKTWLLHSFIRKINLLDRVFENTMYDIWVEDKFGNRLFQKGLKYEPTQVIEYQQISYHRMINHNQYDPSLFNNNHVISMLDGPGDETTGQVATENNNPKTQANVKQAREALKDADYLFVMVHPGIHGDIGQDGDKEIDPNKAGEHFLERLEALRNIKRNPDQRLLLCFTQADEYGGDLAGLNAALASLFGSKSNDISFMLRQLNRQGEELKIHFISSVGYYPDATENGKLVPNYDDGIQTLRSVDLWNPDGVLEPFFEVFDDVQVNYLKKIGRSKNRLTDLLFEKITVPDRLKLYESISNSRMLKEGEKQIQRLLY